MNNFEDLRLCWLLPVWGTHMENKGNMRLSVYEEAT
jgi:hypothetical protein